MLPYTSGRGNRLVTNEWQGLRVAEVTSGRGYERQKLQMAGVTSCAGQLKWQGLRVAGVTSGRAV